MLAERLSSILQPFLKACIVLLVGWMKALRTTLMMVITWIVTDVATVAGAAAIVWGIHFWSIPWAWVAGGLFTIAFVGISQYKLR